MHNTSSYVKMDAVKVRAMCEDVIKRIDKSRNEAKTDYVNERLRKIRKSWWRKLWKKPVPSFEEVMAEEKREQQRPGN